MNKTADRHSQIRKGRFVPKESPASALFSALKQHPRTARPRTYFCPKCGKEHTLLEDVGFSFPIDMTDHTVKCGCGQDLMKEYKRVTQPAPPVDVPSSGYILCTCGVVLAGVEEEAQHRAAGHFEKEQPTATSALLDLANFAEDNNIEGPPDLSENHDHYAWGAEKKEQPTATAGMEERFEEQFDYSILKPMVDSFSQMTLKYESVNDKVKAFIRSELTAQQARMVRVLEGLKMTLIDKPATKYDEGAVQRSDAEERATRGIQIGWNDCASSINTAIDRAKAEMKGGGV